MQHSGFWVLVLAWLAAPVWSTPTSCEGTNISVSTRSEAFATLTCDAVDKATVLFARCNMPPIASPMKIEIVRDLKDDCVALYHCGEDWIEILEPPMMASRRNPDGAFSFLGLDDYYQSVIVHELAHAAFDDVLCPFGACIASSEYVAYAMQIMSLPPDAQMEFVKTSGLGRQVARDELSAVMLFMAPGRFAQKAWAHLSQQPNPCAYIGQIMDGTVLLDRERF